MSLEPAPGFNSPVRVGGVPEHFNLPWQLALDEGAFDDLIPSCPGSAVHWETFPGGTGAMTKALDANELDVALLLFEGAVSNILRGHANRLVQVYVQSPLTWGIHVSAHSPYHHVDDIRDKVYATSRAGSGSHLIAIVDAHERGWRTADMKFSRVGDLDGARTKLADGRVDVFFWERFTTQPLVDKGEFRRIAERVVPWPAFVVSARLEFLNQHSRLLESILEIVGSYSQRLKADPSGPEIVANRYGLQLADAAEWFAGVEWNVQFSRPDDTISLIADYLEKIGILSQGPAGDLPSTCWFDLADS